MNGVASLRDPADQEPLLSITIPTWNRCACLEQLLRELICQWKDAHDELEVVVSDNASTDDTESLVRSLVCNDLGRMRITYFRNADNYGADANVQLAISRARGTYVWLLCDDDLPAPNALLEIYSILSRQETVALYFINRSRRNLEMNEIFCEREHDLEEDMFFADGRDLFGKFRASLLTGSCLVFRRKFCESAYDSQYINGFFCSPMVLALHALAKGGGYFISKPLVVYREGDKSHWSHMWLTIWFYFIPMICHKLIPSFVDRRAFRNIIVERVANKDFASFLHSWRFATNQAVRSRVNWTSLLGLYGFHLIVRPKLLLMIVMQALGQTCRAVLLPRIHFLRRWLMVITQSL